MEAEPLHSLVSDLESLTAQVSQARLSAPELRRILSFIAKVSQVVDQAFQDVLAVLIELKYLTSDDLRSGRVAQLQKEVELLTVRSRYRDAEEICSRLHHLSGTFRTQIEPLLAEIKDAHGWEGMYWLIDEHEGRLITLVHRLTWELRGELEDLTPDHVPEFTQLVSKQLNIVREALDHLRELSNRILGLSGSDGLMELTSTGDTRRLAEYVFINQGSVHMTRDQYKVGQAGAVGPGAHAHDITFNQIWNESAEKIDPAELAAELGELRSALLKEASEPEQYVAIGEIASAETAARDGDGPKALQHLKKAGSWVWDVGTKVGVGVAIAAAKTALGI